MKKQTKKVIGISAIVVSILALMVLYIMFNTTPSQTLSVTGTLSQDFEKDADNLIFKPHPLVIGEGICKATNPPYWGGGWVNYTSRVAIENGKIVVQQVILNREGSANNCGIYFGYIGSWAFEGFCGSKGEFTPCTNVNTVVDDCQSLGVIDSGTTLKCNSYCKPNQNSCYKRTQDDAWEAHLCSSDGSTVTHKICEAGCSNGQCIGQSYSYNPVTLQFPTAPSDGFYGLDNSQQVRVFFDGNPYNGATINGELKSGDTVVGQAVAYSDTSGFATLVFPKVTTSGGVTLKISTKVRGILRTMNTIIYFNDMPPVIMTIDPLRTSYRYGEDVGANVYIKAGSQNLPNTNVQVKIVNQQGATLKEVSAMSDSQGVASISFPKVETIGNARIIATTTVVGRTYTATSSDIFFEGNPFTTTVSARTMVQYSTSPVIYVANVQDNYGKFITPQMITNSRASATLTGGSANSGGATIKYLGSGDYEISIPISGYGAFSSRFLFDYNGQTFQTDLINIEVRQDGINIDTSTITPEGIRGQPKTMRVTFASSSGKLVDPDSITIDVTHPSGIAKDVITKGSMIRISEGVYEFTYTNFNEVEKYTFDVYADKSGYVRGNAKASVSVGGSGTDGMAGTPVIGWVVSHSTYLAFSAIVIVALIVWYVRRRRK